MGLFSEVIAEINEKRINAIFDKYVDDCPAAFVWKLEQLRQECLDAVAD